MREHVLDMIDGLAIGDALPPERKLAASLGVSRMTLRRSLDELVREGYLVRRQGSGTFVANPKISQPLTVSSFSEDMRRRGLTPSSVTLATQEVVAGARLGRRLEISPGDMILKIVRLRLADQQTMAIETLYVPRALVPDLSGADLAERSFYDLLAERYGIRVGSAFQTIEPTVTNAEESAALRVPLHSPAFLFERTTRSLDGQVLEFVRSVYRGDRYQITADLQPPAALKSRRRAPATVKAGPA
ncbi:MAG TPA: GntR family transcriptional regulator [Egibacteraceae bacterium]|nr:GntR family transcriptional regulator [Egibacteraceae bacterium]